MRLTFLTQWFDPEPGAIRGLPLARALVRRGFDVEVVTGFPNYPDGHVYPGYRIRPWQREAVDGVSVLRVALYPSHDQNPIHRVANYATFALSSAVLGPLLTRPADVLYVYHPPPTVGVAAAVFRRAHRVPIVYHIADMWPESALESGMLGQGAARAVAQATLGAYCKWVYGQCKAITVLSPGFKRLLVERGVPADRVHVVYNWADDDLFRPLPRDEGLARELGMAGRFNVVYAGNLGPLQGLETVVRAAAGVRDIPEIQIVFAGGGVDETRLRKLAGDIGATNVRFLGRKSLNEMPAINALADVLLVHLRDLPFFSATVPSKTQVSLASGRPILMAVAGDAADVVRSAGAGLVCPPEDETAMAQAILELHGMDRDRRERLGAHGHEYYLREMSLAVGTERMAELFRTVGGGGAVRRGRRAPARPEESSPA
jgi:glycosyltransferase involved in cell wall biosynthesis